MTTPRRPRKITDEERIDLMELYGCMVTNPIPNEWYVSSHGRLVGLGETLREAVDSWISSSRSGGGKK